MKKAMRCAGISIFAVSMLLPVISQVNLTLGKPSVAPKLIADGGPLPPPLPPKGFKA